MSTGCNPIVPSGAHSIAAPGNGFANDGPKLECIPLSFGQQRLWFLDQLEPNSPLYNIPSLVRIKGRLDISALRRSLNAILARHEILRTRIVSLEEAPSQLIADNATVELRLVDLASHGEKHQEAKHLVREEISRPFNLSTDPLLWRVMMLKLSDEEHLMAITMHHIISDEWSLRIFFRDLSEFYGAFLANRAAALPELPIQYADYAIWQRGWLEGEVLEKQLSYWKKKLHGNPSATELMTDRPRTLIPSFRGGNVARPFSTELSDSLRKLANREEVTLFMLLLAALKALLYRYTQQEDIIVGSPIAGRNQVETEELIGFFVNTLALRTEVNGDLKFRELLRRMRETTLGAYAHQDLPFEKLVEELHPERSLSHLPFTQLMFVVQQGPLEELELAGAELQFLDVESETSTSKFELTIVVQETNCGLIARAEYYADLFERATIERLLRHYERLLGGIAANAGRRIAELPLLSAVESRLLLVEWNRTSRDYPRDKCVHELFEARAERASNSIAVVFGKHSLSYHELNVRANQLAHFLKKFNVGKDVPVAICVERSAEMVVGILAILKAGGAYVPLDAACPNERLEFMLADSQAPVLLTQQPLLPRLPRDLAKVLCLDTDWELIAHEPHYNVPNSANGASLAYIMYTSGSTGRPKGVAVPHRAINRLVLNTNYVEFGSTDRLAQTSNISFDAATFEIWGALLNGGQLIGITTDVALSPRDFAQELRDRGITGIFLTAALFNQLAAEVPGAFSSVRTVIVGGEALDPKWTRAVLEQGPPQRLLNGYGPTENTTFSCCHVIADLAKDATNVPIGRPIANTTVYLLDRDLNPVPIGVPGDLYVGGDGLARGYWHRPELTAEKFILNPFQKFGTENSEPKKQVLLYKTGDVARYLPGGVIEFLGRKDGQVKIRGFRIELGEIESILNQYPGIRECAVTVSGKENGAKRLFAYFVATAGQTPNPGDLRKFLSEKLPQHMVPSAFKRLPALPLTDNGKVDRKALPEPNESRPEMERTYAPPRNAIELELARIWENVLEVHPIGIEDRFFDLGGHSLLAVRVIAQIEKAFGKKLQVATIFQAPTIEQMAGILRENFREAKASGAGSSVVEIQTQGTRPPLFLVHGAGGGMFWGYVNLSRHLGGNQPVYGFRSRGLDGKEEFERIEEMASHYITDMRLVQPRGPYHLGGYCFGGNVAYEMARQLFQQGEQVGLLALINCAPPNSSYTRPACTPALIARFLRNLLYWGNYCRKWSPEQRRAFFRWKLTMFLKNLRALTGVPPEKGRQLDIENMVDLSSFSADQQKLWEVHIRAQFDYYPQPFSGRVHLFRSLGHPIWCSFDPEYGWGDFAESGVEVIVVPAAHEKILEEPFVKIVAGNLEKLLNSENASKQNIKPTTGQVPPQQAEMPCRTPADLARSSQTEQRASEVWMAHFAFWQKQLAGAPALLEFPTDYPRPAHQSCRAGSEVRLLSSTLRNKLKEFCHRHDISEFELLLTTVNILLKRYTRQEESVIATPVDVRDDAQFTQWIRDFNNLVLLRTNFSGDPEFFELFGRVRQTIGSAMQHKALPFEKLLQELCPAREQSYHPLAQVSFMCRRETQSSPDDVQTASIEIEPDTRKFDLSLQYVETAASPVLRVDYSSDLFAADTMRQLLAHWERLLEGIIENPQRRLSELPMLTADEESTLLVDWTNTSQDYPKDKTLIQLFAEQAVRTPGAVALVSGSTRLTYQELQERATCVARRLQSLGVANETLVGICLERSWEIVAGILGTLQAGAAYVPMDPAYPPDRLAFMAQDANLRVLLTQRKLLDSVPRSDAKILCLEDIEWQASRAIGHSKNGESANSRSPKSNDLAYVIYTSGSTGQPKGVAIEHRSAVALVCWARGVFSDEDLDGVLASTSICFDLSIFEIFVPLSWGGKVILADNSLALPELPAASEVRLINTVPSAIRELLRAKGVPRSVRVVNLAGEPLPTSLVEQIYSETSVQRVYDLYGPTETTTYSTFILRTPGQPASIGRPLANEQIYLLDGQRQCVPIGVPGELHIGGDGLARGYLNHAELTTEKFIPHPFRPGARLYKTGDLARWRADGNLEFLGRIDHQVKIRGFRIELGEVEAALKKQCGVGDAVVMAREDASGAKRLVAYVARAVGQDVSMDRTENSPSVSLSSLDWPRGNGGAASGEERVEPMEPVLDRTGISPSNSDNLPTTDDLRRGLRQSLPEYMLPSVFVFLDALPLTPNGKVDRKALPMPEARVHGFPQEADVPLTPVEKQLAEIWSEVLHLKQIGLHDNFFDLGGHSLLAFQVISRIRDAFKVELPLSNLFDAPTIAALAEGLALGRWTPGQLVSPLLKPTPREGVLPVSFVQERLWFLDQLMPGSHAYNVPLALHLKGPLNSRALQDAFNEVIRRHEALRTTFHYLDGSVTQIIGSFSPVEIQLYSESQACVRELLNTEAQRPFDLARGPLIRAVLVRIDESEHALLIVMHHTICDGWSLTLFFHELATLYGALCSQRTAPVLPDLPVQYADFAHWQREWLQASTLERELSHWKLTLEGAPCRLELPCDRPEPAEPSGKAARRRVELGAELAMSITTLSHRSNCTPFMVLLSALALTLHKWTRQKDMVIGTVVAGRNHQQLENIIGCFMNFLPIRLQLNGSEICEEVLTKVRNAVLEAQAHQDCPFEKIVEVINPERTQNQNPLYNVGLLLQNFPAEFFRTDKIRSSSIPINLEAALLDLRFEAEQTAQGFAFECEYKTELFDETTIDQLLASFCRALDVLVRRPHSKSDEVRLTPGLEAQAAAALERTQQQIIAVTATFTAEPVEESLRYWMRELQLPARIQFAPYNQVFQQLLDPTSLLGTNQQGLNVVLIRLEDWQHGGHGADPHRLAGPCNVQRSVNELVLALKSAVLRRSIPYLVCICPPSNKITANAEKQNFVRLERTLSAELENVSGIYLMRPEDLWRWYPVQDYYEPRADELGHVPYTPQFYTALGTFIARKFHALNRPLYKVIVLDCDQTLWSGVCGEDGPAGIRLDPSRRDFQQFMRDQQGIGKLLCLCSKNNEEDVLEVFRERRDFPLRREHLAAWRLNWQSKPENLRSLSAELKLGLDTFIFIDDNPVECAAVQAECPEVLTLQFPENPDLIPQFLNHCWAFDQLKVTAEDMSRTEMYRQNRQREHFREHSVSLGEFLAGLELRVIIEPIVPAQLERVAQLTQRTNQFNFTARRRTESEVQILLSAAEVLTVTVSDRFGDYGLVGVMIYRCEHGALQLDTFLLSCRVLGRGIEHRMLAHLGQIAQEWRLPWVDVHFRGTARNKPALDFLESIGRPFRQPLNDGYLFRFPTGLAAAVAFELRGIEAPATALSETVAEKASAVKAQTPRRKFDRYREVALKACDVAKIHQAIEARRMLHAARTNGYVPPRTDLERQLCGLWQKLLRIEEVGIRNNFFELGGHSLLAVRLFAEMEKLTQRKFPVVTLFQAPTIEQLADLLKEGVSGGLHSLVVPIQPHGARPPLFLVHGAGGDVLWGYANLAAHLPADQPVYGIKSRGQAGLEELTSVPEMAKCYLEEVRAHQPTGPYYLGGYCFGGNVAYEMARQLLSQGQAVALVALLDSAPANAGYESIAWWRPGYIWRFARNVSFWLSDFFALPPRVRFRFVARKTRALGRRLLRSFRPARSSEPVDIEGVIDPHLFPEDELNRWRIHLRALTEHVEQPYSGRVVLFRTRGQPLFCSLAEDFCWSDLARGGVEVKQVSGSHENIFVEPNVQSLAAGLAACLDEAQKSLQISSQEPPSVTNRTSPGQVFRGEKRMKDTMLIAPF